MEKTALEFRKFIDRMNVVGGDDLFAYLYQQYLGNSSVNYSGMHRLGYDFSDLVQQNHKLRLIIDMKNAKGDSSSKEGDLYKWETKTQTGDYEEYRKGEGLIVRIGLEQLIDTFGGNGGLLIGKFTNLVQAKTKSQHAIRFLVESLVLRAIRSKNPIIENKLLLSLRNNEQLPDHSKSVEDVLVELFGLAEAFDFTMLVAYSRLFAFICSNSREEFDLPRLVQNEELFQKRSVLLKLIVEKLTLLSDKFKCPTDLQAYESARPVASEEVFGSEEEKEVFEKFEEEFKKKSEGDKVVDLVGSEREYEIFLEALFRRTSLSHTHLTVLMGRYS